MLGMPWTPLWHEPSQAYPWRTSTFSPTTTSGMLSGHGLPGEGCHWRSPRPRRPPGPVAPRTGTRSLHSHRQASAWSGILTCRMSQPPPLRLSGSSTRAHLRTRSVPHERAVVQNRHPCSASRGAVLLCRPHALFIASLFSVQDAAVFQLCTIANEGIYDYDWWSR